MVQTALNLQLSDQPVAVMGYQFPIILTELVRHHFNGQNEYWIPALNELLYRRPQGPNVKSEVLDSIEIGPIGEYRGDAHTTAPKILVRRDAVARVPNGMDHGKRQVPGMGNQPGTIFEKKWAGSIILFGMSKKKGESELIAFEVGSLLSHFEEKIQDACTLSAFNCNQVGAAGLLREYPNFFATPVVVDYAYVDNVRITEERLPIREITVSIK